MQCRLAKWQETQTGSAVWALPLPATLKPSLGEQSPSGWGKKKKHFFEKEGCLPCAVLVPCFEMTSFLTLDMTSSTTWEKEQHFIACKYSAQTHLPAVQLLKLPRFRSCSYTKEGHSSAAPAAPGWQGKAKGKPRHAAGAATAHVSTAGAGVGCDWQGNAAAPFCKFSIQPAEELLVLAAEPQLRSLVQWNISASSPPV